MDIKEFEKRPIMGILRNIFQSELPSLVSAIAFGANVFNPDYSYHE